MRRLGETQQNKLKEKPHKVASFNGGKNKEDLIGEDRKNKLYCGMGELTTAVNRLNQQYKEISGSDKPLMKYDKFLNCYIITNIWED